MKKRLLSILLAFSLTVGMLTATVLPAMGGVQTPQGVVPLANQTWIEVVGDSAPETGYTISGNKVEISSAQGLAWFAKQVNEGTESFADKTVLLTQTIDLSGYEWVPIGTQSHPFNGTFDGQSYTISGMGITVSGNNTVAGLFGCISNGTVQNVKLAGAKITGEVTGSTEYYIGGIAAANKAMRSKDANKITVTNCEVELEITLNASSTAGVYIGGIIGWTDSNWSGSGAEIKSTTSDLTLDYTGAIKNYNAYVGGFIGRIGYYNGSFTIEECSGLLDGKISSGFSPKDLSIGRAFGYSSSSSSPADNKPAYMQIKSSNVVSRLNF